MFRSYSLRLEITVIELSFSNCLSRCRCVWYSVFKVQISVHIFRYLLWLIFINRMETTRFELVTPCLQGRCSPNWAIPPYGITAFRLMGLNGLEPSTSRLSGVRSNQLSYKPILIWRPPTLPHRLQCSTIGRSGLNHRVRDGNGCYPWTHRHQKVLSSLMTKQ